MENPLSRLRTSFASRLLHGVIVAWIQTNPGFFLDLIARDKDWAFARNWVNVKFVRPEMRAGQEHVFYDVFMVVEAKYRKGDGTQNYCLLIEVKTGRFNDRWVEQLERLYKSRSKSGWDIKQWSIYCNILPMIFIAREPELEKLKHMIQTSRTETYFLLRLYPLEKLLPYIIRDLEESLETARRILDSANPEKPENHLKSH
jgi:hypothetical protein